MLVHGLGHEAGVAGNLLDLLTPSFALTTLVTHDAGPGVLVDGAVGEDRRWGERGGGKEK